MDGGRKKWLAEGKELSTEAPKLQKKTYKAKEADNSLRAFLPEVQDAVKGKRAALVDVRSPAEFTGEILAPPGLPETCQRGGHAADLREICRQFAAAIRQTGRPTVLPMEAPGARDRLRG